VAALKWIGLALLALAMFVSLVALRSRPEPSADGADANTHPSVVADRPLDAGTPIEASSLRIELRAEPALGGFTAADDVIGRVPMHAVTAGRPILESDLSPLGALSRNLRIGETAVAVKVDRVTGLGGFVRPGDAVDVLFLLRRDGREVAETQARTLLRNVRVLAFGNQLESPDTTEPTLNPQTAVLAVLERDAPLLLLADVAGTLRLALRYDHGPASSAPTFSISLEELLQEARKPTGTRKRDVIPVIRGGGTRPDGRR